MIGITRGAEFEVADIQRKGRPGSGSGGGRGVARPSSLKILQLRSKQVASMELLRWWRGGGLLSFWGRRRPDDQLRRNRDRDYSIGGTHALAELTLYAF